MTLARLRSLATRALIACGVAVLALTALRLWPHAPLRERLGSSTPVLARDGTLLRLTLAGDQQYRLWTPLAQIAPVQVETVLLYEDRAFWWHPGVNPVALARGAWNSAFGSRREGGSTLTMQLARRLYAIDSRSPGGKLRQAVAALWLEARFSKHDLLEAYLNCAPYGSNIEGVGAASLIYFNHPAAAITLPEALTLAVIPQNPLKRLATGNDAENSGSLALQQARARLWALWSARHALAQAQALPSPPTLGRARLPFEAPHLTDMLLAQSADSGGIAARESDGAIHATIDPRMQRTLERVMAGYVGARSSVGIRNASALLLDASTMEVRAVVGSAAYGNAAIFGQVNGTLAKRSPGSTLKPFIYALALDQGLLHPRTILKDAPTAFGPFTPENFDGQFMGPLAAQDALTRSRNIPAVSVAARLQQPDLYQFLQLNHVSRLASADHYGLALVLGGGEVTPEELARMYAVLANAGDAQPLAYTREQSRAVAKQEPQHLLSPEAAFITLDMLRQTPRPDTGAPAAPPIAWKTGTSWGFRDAWTAGVFGRHVLVVWVGDFDGAGNPAFIGIDAAAPLFLRMVDALRAQGLDPGAVARPQPPDLRRVEVCAATGGPPDALCPARVQTWFIAGKSPQQAGAEHRSVWVDTASGRTLCGPDGAASATAHRVVVEQWGSDMQRLFRQSGMPRRVARPGDCAAPSAQAAADDAETPGEAPVIGSPLRGLDYILNPRAPQRRQLRAEAAADVRTLYWFAGNALLGRTAPGEGLAWQPPTPGRYELRVVDDKGRADYRALQVQLAP
ncbi:MAG: penicillin-binding protein 1C [Betaproteobacteria bacterium]